MDDSEDQTPPSPGQVAARAIALAAVVSRGFIEVEQDRREAETRRLHLSDWLERIGAIDVGSAMRPAGRGRACNACPLHAVNAG
jgi:hypothetical protein